MRTNRGSGNRTEWGARDASHYLKNWRTLGAFRDEVVPGASQKTVHFNRKQRQETMYKYLEDFWRTNATEEQMRKGSTYVKSCAEARLRNMAGSRVIVFAIWEVGNSRARFSGI